MIVSRMKMTFLFLECLRAGILEDMTNEPFVSHGHYPPHCPLIRYDHATTKVRIV